MFQGKRKNLKTFVNVGCNDWHNIIERQSIHEEQNIIKMLLKILIDLVIVLKKQKEPLITTQIPFIVRGVINIQKC